MPENEGSRPQKRTKMPILCSGMVAASQAWCIWQQCARQKIAATYHATCPVHAAGHTTVSKQPGYLLPLIPPRSYRKKATAVCYRRHTCRRTTCRRVCYRNLPPRPTRPGILPCSGSRAQRAGDSDVGANDKGAGDDPGDWVDAH